MPNMAQYPSENLQIDRWEKKQQIQKKKRQMFDFFIKTIILVL